MKKILPIITIVLIIIGFGVWWQLGTSNIEDIEQIESGNIPTSADNAPPGSIHNLPVPDAVGAVRALVAQELGISEGVVIIMSAYVKNWSSSCLGLEQEGEKCALVVTPGYEVTVLAQGKERLYHTNHDGSSIRRKE